MKFSYLKTPINRYTFKSERIKVWVESNVEELVLNLFAGKVLLKCREIRNDINENMPGHYHMDALDFCNYWKEQNYEKFRTILLDPPYSYRKSMTKYEGRVMSPFNALKNVLPSILEDSGIVITFGYHSVSMGTKRGFRQEHILLISHSGAIHDTIATIERQLKESVLF